MYFFVNHILFILIILFGATFPIRACVKFSYLAIPQYIDQRIETSVQYHEKVEDLHPIHPTFKKCFLVHLNNCVHRKWCITYRIDERDQK